MKSTARFLALGSLAILLFGSPVAGQLPNSMYFMPGVPQSNRINPAIQPGCGFYLGIPGAAPVRLKFNSSTLGFNDVFMPSPTVDTLRITPLHPDADKEGFINTLNETNNILLEGGVSLASFGFRSGKNFLSFDWNVRMDGALYYPRGLFELAFTGLEDGGSISLDGLGVDATVFHELGLGWSRKDFLIPNLDIGVRGKLLFGLGNIATKNSSLTLNTSMDEWTLHSQIEIAASAPELVTITENPEQIYPDFFVDTTIFEKPVDVPAILSNVFSLDQFGLAADIGINYRPIEQLQISASVLDIGGINWKNSVTATYEFDYTFTGVEVNPFTDFDTTLIDQLQDSLLSGLNVVAGEPYRAGLNTKLFVGAAFYPVEKIGIGVVSRTDFLNDQLAQQFTGTVNMTTGKFINLSMSYSYVLNSINMIGAGFSFNAGPFNLYLISDNLVSAALKPFDARAVNLWFGMNLTFGWKRAKKEKKKDMDMPLIL
jgi:hypothetical protein